MGMLRLNPLDAAWIMTETREAPNHVALLMTFRLPADAPRDFLRKLMHDFRSERRITAPWNRRLKATLGLSPVQTWIEEDEIDFEYHVRHAALPWPGGERELGELVGRLQSTPIDLKRPPWDCTIIEGLDHHRFALYLKMHHSLIDGVSGMRMLLGAMSHDREKSVGLPPWWGAETAQPSRHPHAPTMAGVIDAVVQGVRDEAKSLPSLAAAFGKMAARIGDPREGLVVPFDSPRSVLNGRVRPKRRFATQQFALSRLRRLADVANCKINDVVLAICGGALRRFLYEQEALPEKSLTAGIPVSVRPKDDLRIGNAISFIVSTLGTDIADPAERLKAVKASVGFAKAHVQSLPRQAMTQYTILLMAPTIVSLLTGIGGRTRPMFNITVSNVPGPEKPLYFQGAELLAAFPVSIVSHGQALNITCHSYSGNINFGFTGCHTSVPSLQRLAVYSAEALKELEDAVLPHPHALVSQKGARRSAAKKAPARKRAAAPAATD